MRDAIWTLKLEVERFLLSTLHCASIITLSLATAVYYETPHDAAFETADQSMCLSLLLHFPDDDCRVAGSVVVSGAKWPWEIAWRKSVAHEPWPGLTTLSHSQTCIIFPLSC